MLADAHPIDGVVHRTIPTRFLLSVTTVFHGARGPRGVLLAQELDVVTGAQCSPKWYSDAVVSRACFLGSRLTALERITLTAQFLRIHAAIASTITAHAHITPAPIMPRVFHTSLSPFYVLLITAHFTHTVSSLFFGEAPPHHARKKCIKSVGGKKGGLLPQKTKKPPPPSSTKILVSPLDTADFRTKGDDFKGTSRTCVRAASSSPLLTTTFSNAVPFLPHTHKKQRAISTSPFPPFPPSYPTRRVFCVGGFREPHTHTL